MRKKKFLMITAVWFVSGLFVSVQAGPVNSRPVAVDGSSLQLAIDAITLSGPGIDVNADQHDTAWFTNTASGGSVSTFLVDAITAPNLSAFGIYEIADPGNRATIFSGSMSPGDQALVSFLANGDVLVNGNVAASGFNDPKTFGYFLDVLDADVAGFGDGDDSTVDYTVYTDDHRNNLVNPSGDARVLVFQGDNQTVLQAPQLGPGTFQDNEFILAFENGSPDSNVKDFSDFVLVVESVAPIPEPATGLLLLAGLGGLFRARRARS